MEHENDHRGYRFTLDREHAAALDKIAAAHGVEPETLITHIVENYLRDERLGVLRATGDPHHGEPAGFTTWRDELTFGTTPAPPPATDEKATPRADM